MFWVIMMFSACIPMLYLAGVLICFTTYWTDKTMFIKYYRLPPRHGATLANTARSIVEWSLLLHLFMGFYMISNPDIFTNEEDDNEAVAFFAGYAKTIAGVISLVTGVNSERFGQVHAVFYSVGIGIFVIMFIFEKVSGTFSRLMGKFCCKWCLNKNPEPAMFSNDCYLEF